MPLPQSKWITFFNEHPRQESDKSLMAYFKRLAEEHNQNAGLLKSKYHLYAAKGKINKTVPLFHKLPKSHAQTKEPMHLEGKKMLCLFDVHVPYHDPAAFNCAIEKGLKEKCDTILLGGDFMDAHEISSYTKDKFKPNFLQEVQAVKQLLSFLRFKFPKAIIYAKMGNHEDRYRQYIRRNAAALEGLASFELAHILDFEKFGVIEVGSSTMMLFNELAIIHGHEFGKSVFNPVNVARGLYNRAKTSAMCGHSHVTSEHTETDIKGKITTCWSVGCLSELRPDYQPFSKYNHGFAIVSRRTHTGFHVQNYRVNNGKIL